MGMQGDFLSLGECRLQNLRVLEIKRNNEVIGEKTVLDVVTWGKTHEEVEVDSGYAETLAFNKSGRCYLNVDVCVKDDTIIYQDKKTGQTKSFTKKPLLCENLVLTAFEVSK